jgi:L-ascorbate metabolism protein UlaG (beta-lactamase superfamily)
VGYPIPKYEPDIITESHQHFDHNAHYLFKNQFMLINTPGVHNAKGVKITGLKTYHDKTHGHERGENIIFKFEFSNGITIAHCGDLGHIPDKSIMKELQGIDILMIPVGGYYTIDAKQAKEIVEIIKPKIIMPMHYKTNFIDFPINYVDNFVDLFDIPVVKLEKEFEVDEVKESKIVLFRLKEV